VPKELTHWTLAMEVRNALPSGPLKKCLETHLPLYLFGAVVHDSSYYTIRGHPFPSLDHAEKILNGTAGEDTFDSIRRLLKDEPRGNPATLALAVGALTHILADASFHPLVYYVSGRRVSGDRDRNRTASIRHHTFETYLDIYVASAQSLPNRGRVRNLLKGIPVSRSWLVQRISAFYGVQGSAGKTSIRRAIRNHAWIQSLFFRPSIRFLVNALGTLPIFDRDLILSSFYPSPEPVKIPFFEHPIEYRHPVLGNPIQTTIQEMGKQTAARLIELLTPLDELLAAGQAHLFLDGMHGPGLSTGLLGVPYDSMVHFETATPMMELLLNPK